MSAQGSAGRARAQARRPSGGELEAVVDSARAAVFLGVSHQHVRRLLRAGAEYEAALAAAGPDEVVVEPGRYLLGDRVERAGRGGGPAWRIPRSEVDRLAGDQPGGKFRPGYDVTLRPPKSVSVLWALSPTEGRAAIRQAHSEAVDEVVRYLEDRAVRARLSGKAGRYLVETDGVIAAAFDHRTSRAGDPLLHTHVVVANMTRVDTADGSSWRAIAAHGLFEHAKAGGHLYQAHLRRLLSDRLGVRWGVVRNGYGEVDGVPESVIEVFSKRRGEIEEVLAESGTTSARAAQIATLATRKPKGYDVNADTLYDEWRREAAHAGFTPADAAGCLHREQPGRPDEVRLVEVFERIAGPRGLTERASTFRRSEVIESLSTLLAAGCSAGEIEALADRFLASDRCVVVDDAPSAATQADQPAGSAKRRGATQASYTTIELAVMEVELLGWAAETSSTGTAVVGKDVVQSVLSGRPELSVEQAAMVQRLCGFGPGVEPVAGRPGAGKTYATEAVVAAHVAAGVPIVGCAVSAAAAAELESSAGFARSMAPATTVARLLLDLEVWGGLAAGSVVVVDEASMIGTRDLHALVGHARRAGGRVVLVGDPDQHGPVEVGGVFQRLCRDRGDGLVRLVENNRQRDHVDRLAIAEYRDGHVDEALDRLDNAGRVVRSSTAGESFDAMVADWYADHLTGRADPMIAGPNSTRRALNDRARALLKEHNELRGTPLVIAGREFLIGDLVVARRNDRRLRPTPSTGGEFVKNGSAGIVVEVHCRQRELTVEFEREGRVRLPERYLAAGHLEHGYARTTYGVQGATHATARYHPTDLSGFEEGYVALTRGRDENRVYLVDGSISTGGDDEAHHRPDPERFDLDDLTAGLQRRRTGSMAADAADRLPDVHALAASKSLAHLAEVRRRLEARLADAPGDVTAAIGHAAQLIDKLRARRSAIRLGPGAGEAREGQLDRAVERAELRLHRAEQQQRERQRWLDEHGDVVDEYRAVVRAEQHRRTRIAENPAAYLPNPKPDETWRSGVQRDRRQQREQLVKQALAADLDAGSDELSAPAAGPKALAPGPDEPPMGGFG